MFHNSSFSITSKIRKWLDVVLLHTSYSDLFAVALPEQTRHLEDVNINFTAFTCGFLED